MADHLITDDAAVIGPATRGAVIKAVHVERQMRVYPIYESELTTLSMFSTAVTVCASIASGTFVFLLSIAWDMATSSDAATQSVGRTTIGIGVGVIIVSVVLAGWATSKQKSQLQEILRQSSVV